MGRPKGSKNKTEKVTRVKRTAKTSYAAVQVAAQAATGCGSKSDGLIEKFTDAICKMTSILEHLEGFKTLQQAHNNLGQISFKAFDHLQQMDARIKRIEDFLSGKSPVQKSPVDTVMPVTPATNGSSAPSSDLLDSI